MPIFSKLGNRTKRLFYCKQMSDPESESADTHINKHMGLELTRSLLSLLTTCLLIHVLQGSCRNNFLAVVITG